MADTISLTLRVWRQAGAGQGGRFVDYPAKNLSLHMSFLEMLDVVNDELTAKGDEPIAFAHDCREGICGTCSLQINGKPHGPNVGVATCQTYVRSFADGDIVIVEPFRAAAFPVIKDLVTDRTALDRIQQAGGFITVRAGSAPDGNAIPIPKGDADLAMDAAQCIQCGACVATCKNASTNQYECSAACPKLISQDFIARLNRDFIKASFRTAFRQPTNAAAGE
jgi:succinate dehydrogenase / fumarate reductase iron-sulfur subunit